MNRIKALIIEELIVLFLFRCLGNKCPESLIPSGNIRFMVIIIGITIAVAKSMEVLVDHLLFIEEEQQDTLQELSLIMRFVPVCGIWGIGFYVIEFALKAPASNELIIFLSFCYALVHLTLSHMTDFLAGISIASLREILHSIKDDEDWEYEDLDSWEDDE